MKKQIILSIILALMFLVTSISADSIKLKTAVKIDTLEIIGTPKENNVIQLRVKFTSYVNSNASIILKYTDYITTLENTNIERQFKEKINLSIESSLERIYSLKVISDAASQISVALVLDNSIPGWTNNDSRYLNIETIGDQYKIYEEKVTELFDIKEIQSYFGVDPLLKKKTKIQLQKQHIMFQSAERYSSMIK